MQGHLGHTYYILWEAGAELHVPSEPLAADNSFRIWGTFHEHSRGVASLSLIGDRMNVADTRPLGRRSRNGRREPLSTLSQSFHGGSLNDWSGPIPDGGFRRLLRES